MKKPFLNIRKIVVLGVITAFLNVNFGNNVIAIENNNQTPYIVGTYEGHGNQIAETAITEKNVTFLENDMFVMKLTSRESEIIKNEDNVLFIEEDFTVTANNFESSNYELDDETFLSMKRELFENSLTVSESVSEWNLQAVNADELNTDKYIENKIKVAVLDSGVDAICNVDLAGTVNLVPEEREISPMFLDLTGHGTSIASIIAGNGEGGLWGINPNVELYSVKVLDENNSAPVSRIIEGIYWCIDNDIDIINMSFGTSNYSIALEKAVKDAYNEGILMIGAAGNNNDTVEYPAAFDEVMAVASVNTNSEISEFCNTGVELEIAAPGEKIKSAGFFGGNIITHGTSISVPHVVGVASILWEKDSSKSNEFIRELIKYSSKSIENFNECGLLDAEFALEIYDIFEQTFNGETVLSNNDLPVNSNPAPSFDYINDDENYVEGRWTKNGHEGTVDDSDKYGMSTTEVNILKKGCVYPDTSESGTAGASSFPEWHGFYRYGSNTAVNYIACYNFVQKIAQKSGDTTSFTSHTGTPGLGSLPFSWIKDCFSSTGFGYGNKVSYSTILSNWSYSSQSASTQARYRQLFIYGLSIHIMGDVFAHSTFDTNLELINHDGIVAPADNTLKIPNRYKCAKAGVEQAVWNASYAQAYSWLDFSFAAAIEYNGGEHKFYVANILKHARNTGMPSSGYEHDCLSFLSLTVSPAP